MHKSTASRIAGLLILVAAVGCGGAPETETGPGPAAPPAPEAQAPADSGEATPVAGPVTGSAAVTGTVTYDGDVPKLKPLRMDADPGCLKKHTDPVMPEVLVLGDEQRMANVFVRVKSGLPDAKFPPPSEPVVLDQKGCRYEPHVVGVMIDQPFKILNSDGLLHNVHSLPEINTPFNRAMPAAVTEVEYSFSKEEFMFKVKCDVHPWMGAWVAVLGHPYFAVTDSSGAYSLSGLPAGTYEIEAWHERLGTQTSTVTLTDGESTEIDFTFKTQKAG